MINKITQEIKKELKKTAPKLTREQITWRKRILNSDNPQFTEYGHKVSDIERITNAIYKKVECNYEDSLEVFNNLVMSNVQEEKFAGFFILNHFKGSFDEETIDNFEKVLSKYCDTWAFCDTSCIRVIGPFLGKKNNQVLAYRTIEKWSNSKSVWVRRASLVILLKIIMIQKKFDDNLVYKFVEKMHKHPEDYIQKAIGWLLKTCSKYNPDSVFIYLMNNKGNLSRLILRYASEKLPKEMRAQILLSE
ncbi:MAG: DNA alkylation repair protein [Promethearchaeota archaeon]